MKNIEYDIWRRIHNSSIRKTNDDVIKNIIQVNVYNKIQRRIEYQIVVVAFTDDRLILLNFD